MLPPDFQDNISDGLGTYEEKLPETKLSTLDGLGSYEEFQLSLKQMTEYYNSKSYFHQYDQEIPGNTRKMLAGLSTISSILPQPLHQDDYGIQSHSPPTNYGYSSGQAVNTPSVQHDAQVQDDASVGGFEKHSIREEHSGNPMATPFLQVNLGSALASFTLKTQDHDTPMEPPCQNDIQGVQELAPSIPPMHCQGKSDVDISLMYKCQGGIQGVQELVYPNSPMPCDGHVSDASSMQLCKGDIQKVQPLGNQEDGASYRNLFGKVEATPSMNVEGRIHQSGIDHSDAMPSRPQEESVAVSNVRHGSNLVSKSKIKRRRHSPEDLLKLRNYYNNSPADSSRNPSFSECLALSYGTNLDYKQISTWFSNERARTREKVRESGDSEDIISTNRKRHSDFQINLLKAWVAKNEPNDPSPSTKDRKELARDTGLSLEQVSGWFMNLRKNRKKAALRNELSEES